MEMKKLLRGYGIREVNLLNKEIMVSTMKSLRTPFLGQYGKFNETLRSSRQRVRFSTNFLLWNRMLLGHLIVY